MVNFIHFNEYHTKIKTEMWMEQCQNKTYWLKVAIHFRDIQTFKIHYNFSLSLLLVYACVIWSQ